MKSLKNIDRKKVVQILAVYLFALFAAVACGESFPVKKKGDGSVTLTAASREDIPSELSISMGIGLVFTDGAAIVNVPPAILQVQNGQPPGAVTYQGFSFTLACKEVACQTLAVTIQKLQTQKTTSFLLVIAPDNKTYVIKTRDSNSNFPTAVQALNALVGQSTGMQSTFPYSYGY
jgi:hypothetical protein